MTSSSTVYTIDGDEDAFVTEIKETLFACDEGNNPDLVVVFKGYLHNKSGFKFRVENLEVFDAHLIDHWKAAIGEKGMTCEINADLSNSWVDITCKRMLRHRKSLRQKLTEVSTLPSLSSIPFSLIAYICLMIIVIYILWQRHQERFLK